MVAGLQVLRREGGRRACPGLGKVWGGAHHLSSPPSAARAHGDPAQPAVHAGLRPARAGDCGPEGQRQRHSRGARVPAAGERGGRPDQPAEPGVGVRGPCRAGRGWVGGGPGSRPLLLLTRLRPHSFAEQLVLYLKVAELLSSGLQTAIDQIRAGKLCLSSTVKQGECSPPGAAT